MSRVNSSSAFRMPFAFCFVRKQYTPSADAMTLTVWPLFSADSANAISYMPYSDRSNYNSVMNQMYGALYELNVEPDFVQVGDRNLSRYKVLLVPPLYSASDPVLQQVSDYVAGGGHLLMAFKSGFTNQYSTVRDVMAPGPLRKAAGFHYQEFSSL